MAGSQTSNALRADRPLRNVALPASLAEKRREDRRAIAAVKRGLGTSSKERTAD